MRAARRVTERDRLLLALLWEHRVSRCDGFGLREADAGQGFTYEAARKRRQRAEAALRRLADPGGGRSRG